MKTKQLFIQSFFLVFSLCLSGSIQAQCTTCTNSISANTSSGLIVASGQTVCIAPSVTVDGGIVVLSGGKVCNQGSVNGGIVIYAGGVVDNFGDSTAGGITNNGVFNNYSVFNINDGVNNSGSLNNFGTMTLISGGLAIDSGGYLNNTATGAIIIELGGCMIGDSLTSGRIDNYGCMKIANGGILIGHINSVFYTQTMVIISGGGFSNYGTVTGPTTSCGGFEVVSGGSINYGTYGVLGNLDMCDRGNPMAFGANFGTVGANVTYCQCQNYCTITSGINDSDLKPNQVSLYPNPATDVLHVEFAMPLQNVEYQIIDVFGKIAGKGRLKNNTVSIANITTGVYTIHFTDSEKGENTAPQRFIKQ